MHCKGRRVHDTSFKSNLHLVESKTSRHTCIKKDRLKPGTEYTIYVTAFTVRGEGAPSDAVTVRTPAKGNSQHHHSVMTVFEKPFDNGQY